MTNQPAYFTEHRVRFEFRKTRAVEDLSKEGTVYALIYVVGQAPSLQSTGIRATRADWKARGASRTTESVKHLNRSLVLWEESIYAATRALLAEGKLITAQAIMGEVNYLSKPLIGAEVAFQKFLNFKKQRIGPDRAELRKPGQICLNTFRQYENRWASFRSFLKAQRKDKVVLSAIDQPLIQQYYHYLMTQSIASSTATKRVKVVTELCQWAVREGLIPEFRVGGFRGHSAAEAPPHNVTEEEIARIESIEMPTTLAQVRDGWLLARELCLHYGDYMALQKQHFIVDKQGRLLFDKARIKQEAGRNIRQVSIVSERAMSIWYRYGQQPPCQVVNGVYGRYLKEIGQLAELNQPLMFSHARDSGIFKLVAAGCPEFVIKLAAGWTTTKQLSRYVNHDRRLLEEYKMPASYVDHQEVTAPAYQSLVSTNHRLSQPV